MDIRSLTCFLAVADTLHFHRAAQRLHLTQPALSQRIRALEEEVGVRLLERNRRVVALTEAGRAFLEPARNAVAEAARARLQALRATKGEVGHLRLGFTVIAFYGLLPVAVRLYRSRYPEVAVELAEMNSPALERALLAGEIDLGILHPPLGAVQLSTQALPDERLVLALPEQHRLTRKRRIALRDLRSESWLMAPREVGPHFHDRLIALFHADGFSPSVVQHVSPMTTLTGLVAAGVGMGFVTEGIASVPRPGVAFRAVSPAPPSLPQAAAWYGACTIAAQRFLQVVDEVFEAQRS
ncbi:LysR family transcriptional regulator [Paracidovorax citrulli]